VALIETYSLAKGLKHFGKEGEVAVSKELAQLHDLVTYTPVDSSHLTAEQRKNALNSFMFLVQKRCGKVKARAVADGSKQRLQPDYKKTDSASPTVSTDSIMITGAIEAHEGRVTATIGVPGAFLNAYLDTVTDEEVLMLLKGKLAELMVMVQPKMYRKYVTYDSKGNPMLYVKMSKAMYGMLQSALAFYLKLRNELEEYGFVVNNYDPCVANKTIDGTQMTVCWHVDDLKVSHAKKEAIDDFAQYLRDIYGDELKVNHGDIHDYLGMDLDYSKKGKF